MKEICIIGLGYIGLPTAAMFASHGIKVEGIDIKKEICDTINQGNIHIQEPNLAEVVKKCVDDGMLTASTKIKPSAAFIIAVPTPLMEDKKADLSYIKSAAEQIYPVLKKGDLVILESTVPPRCTTDILLPILESSGLMAGKDFYLAHCPERVLPGNIIYELQYNNKIIGGINAESAEKAKQLYSSFVKGEMYLTDTTTAELCKLMENTYRDVNIALVNELAKICERLGVNVWDVIEYANKHPRVHLHYPGPGVGGHCLAIDPWFIIEKSCELSEIMLLARKTNDSMPYYLKEKINRLLPKGGKITILGCTYKPNIDDMRESPILKLVDLLNSDKRYKLMIADPYIDKYNKDIYEASADSDLLILGVNHDEFKDLDFRELYQSMHQHNIIDTRNFWDKQTVIQDGFTYLLLGDGTISQEMVAIDEVAATK